MRGKVNVMHMVILIKYYEFRNSNSFKIPIPGDKELLSQLLTSRKFWC